MALPGVDDLIVLCMLLRGVAAMPSASSPSITAFAFLVASACTANPATFCQVLPSLLL